MTDFAKKVKEQVIEEDEEIIDRVIISRQALFSTVKDYVFLTNKRVIFKKKSWRGNISYIPLDELAEVAYSPNVIVAEGTGGISAVTDAGEHVRMTNAAVGEMKAKEFIDNVRELI